MEIKSDMMNYIKVINKDSNDKAPRPITKCLGYRGATTKWIISKMFSIDINIDPRVQGFEEGDLKWETDKIEKALLPWSHIITKCEIHNEDAKYIRIDGSYHVSMPTKLHWHGLIQFNKKLERVEYEHIFKTMSRKLSICKNSTKVMVYKKIKDSQHLKDRQTYISKQNVFPIIKL